MRVQVEESVELMRETDLAQESAVSLSGILPRPGIQVSTEQQSKSLFSVKYNYKPEGRVERV